MREIAERAHDIERLRDRQLVEERRRARRVTRGASSALGATEADRGLADRFDARVACHRRSARAATSPSRRPSRRVSSRSGRSRSSRRHGRIASLPGDHGAGVQRARQWAERARSALRARSARQRRRRRVQPALVVARDHVKVGVGDPQARAAVAAFLQEQQTHRVARQRGRRIAKSDAVALPRRKRAPLADAAVEPPQRARRAPRAQPRPAPAPAARAASRDARDSSRCCRSRRRCCATGRRGRRRRSRPRSGGSCPA